MGRADRRVHNAAGRAARPAARHQRYRLPGNGVARLAEDPARTAPPATARSPPRSAGPPRYAPSPARSPATTTPCWCRATASCAATASCPDIAGVSSASARCSSASGIRPQRELPRMRMANEAPWRSRLERGARRDQRGRIRGAVGPARRRRMPRIGGAVRQRRGIPFAGRDGAAQLRTRRVQVFALSAAFGGRGIARGALSEIGAVRRTNGIGGCAWSRAFRPISTNISRAVTKPDSSGRRR